MNSAEIWTDFWSDCPGWADVDYGDPDVVLELEDGDEVYVVELEE